VAVPGSLAAHIRGSVSMPAEAACSGDGGACREKPPMSMRMSKRKPCAAAKGRWEFVMLAAVSGAEVDEFHNLLLGERGDGPRAAGDSYSVCAGRGAS